MIRTELAERILLIVLVAGVGLNELFHAIFDGLQFMFNVDFVGTVLSMESTFEPDSWRAIESSVIAFLAYTLIWAAHALSGIFCLAGSYLLAKTAASDDSPYERAICAATVGVGIGCVLYLVGFEAIAGGWFLLYQAPTPPNFIPSAERLFLCYVAVLIYLAVVRRKVQFTGV